MRDRRYGHSARMAALAERVRRLQEIHACTNLIKWYFAPADHDRAIRAAWAFSGMCPSAENSMGDGRFGLFQIAPSDVGMESWDGSLLLNPVRNVAAARVLVDRLGWYSFPAGPVPPPTEHSAWMED